ncbi:MAG: hypothetical protein Q8O37_06650 [Sulfuricellaceae bacterium]|nr:hypothetical protein [Sulfuricellaceae bacterium]
MNTIALRQIVTADASHTIHVKLPPEISDRVEVIVMSAANDQSGISEDSLVQARLMDESGFAKDVLNNPEEDCWNEL